MAVTKEFRCLAHGEFDGSEPVCPKGCTTVVREFRTAPAGKSSKTKGVDRTLASLAARFGFSDMSNRDGSVGSSKKNSGEIKPVWGDMPKGNIFVPGKGEVNAKGEAMSTAGGGVAALAGMGITGQSVAAQLSQKLGREVTPEPTFVDIAKGLPKPRPIIDKRFSYGTQADLDKAIAK